MALVAIAAALLTASLVGGSGVRMIGAAAVVLAAIGVTAWQTRRASRTGARAAALAAPREAAIEAAIEATHDASDDPALDGVERARRELLSDMSHELRTPLNSVIGFSSVLLRSCADRLTSQELEYLERVRANGVQLLRVVDDGLARGAATRGATDEPGTETTTAATR